MPLKLWNIYKSIRQYATLIIIIIMTVVITVFLCIFRMLQYLKSPVFQKTISTQFPRYLKSWN